MKTGLSKKILLTFGISFALIAVLLVMAGIAMNNRAREAFLLRQAQEQASPQTAVKRQVKRVLLKRESKEGIEYIEILPNGQVNIYDENFNLKKSGTQGYTTVNNLYDKINRNLDSLDQLNFGGNAKYTLTVETNQGSTTIIIDNNGGDVGGDGLDDDLEDIIEDIEDIEDEVENPPPTASPQPSPTIGPSPTGFIPTPSATPVISPTPTPSPGPGTPTPLPGYMTAPPFTCDDYDNLGRPVIISNTTCGAD